jgi:hypothetical protein
VAVVLGYVVCVGSEQPPDAGETMRETITRHEYYTEVRDLAQSAWDDSKEYDTDARDTLWETVDGHQWVIYTHYNAQILLCSDNDNAYFEDFGPLEADTASDAVLKMAFAAFYRDCSEALGDIEADAEDEEEED